LNLISVPVEDAKKKTKSVEIIETDDEVDLSEEEEEEVEETEASSEESDNNTDNDEADPEGADSDEDWSQEKNDKKEDAKRKAALLKRKRKAVEKKTPSKKIKKSDDDVKGKNDKKNAKGKEKVEKKEETTAGEKKKELPDFSDKNVDVNLYNDDPNTVTLKRIKVSENVVVSCKMISVNQKQANGFDYAAIVFARKGKTEKAFEYNLPLNLAPKLVTALNIIIKENPKFFQSYENSSTPTKKSES